MDRSPEGVKFDDRKAPEQLRRLLHNDIEALRQHEALRLAREEKLEDKTPEDAPSPSQEDREAQTAPTDLAPSLPETRHPQRAHLIIPRDFTVPLPSPPLAEVPAVAAGEVPAEPITVHEEPVANGSCITPEIKARPTEPPAPPRKSVANRPVEVSDDEPLARFLAGFHENKEPEETNEQGALDPQNQSG